MVEDVRRIQDRLQIEKSHVVGYSMGAVIANKFCERYPERLTSVTLAGYGQPPLPEKFTDELREQVSTNLRRMNLLANNDPRALALLSVEWSAWNVDREQLSQNTVPALALIGADDAFLPDTLELARRMKGLEVVTVSGDHGSTPNQPQFTKELLRFLAQVDTTSSSSAAASPK